MDRPGLQGLLKAAYSPARSFDVILVDDTSRLSRSTADILSIHHELKFRGLQLIAISQNIDSLQDQAETLFTIQGLIDSTYVRDLAKKVHRGCESAVLRGLHVGGTCFGYLPLPEGTSGSKKLVIEESQAEVVRRIFEMSIAGHSLKGIAKSLNEERTSGRGNWCPTGIRSMLKQEIYKGEVIWNRTRFEKVPGTNKRRAKPRDESEWLRIQRPELAIVSVELWRRVQDRLNSFGSKSSEGRHRGLFSRAITSPYLFSGLLKCGDCGGNLIVGTGGGTHVHKKYVCANYFNRGSCENDLYIRRDVLRSDFSAGCNQNFCGRKRSITPSANSGGNSEWRSRGSLVYVADLRQEERTARKRDPAVRGCDRPRRSTRFARARDCETREGTEGDYESAAFDR